MIEDLSKYKIKKIGIDGCTLPNPLIPLKKFAFAAAQIADYKKHPDYIWCERALDDAKGGVVPNKEEFIMANLMWKKYNGGVSVDEKTIWLLIDTLLEQDSKIGAIKMYRRFINSSLREAKDHVDSIHNDMRRTGMAIR